MNERIKAGQEYLTLLHVNLSRKWPDLFKSYQGGQLSLIEKLTLIHPEHLQTLALPNYKKLKEVIVEIQGPRNFSDEPGTCYCWLIWGYECFFNSERCCGDHLFPYSLGGPTSAGNKLLLCRYHNMVKSSDIHLYPWEELGTRTSWLDNQIVLINGYFSQYY